MPIPIRSISLVLTFALATTGTAAVAQSPVAPSPVAPSLPPLFDDTAIPATPDPGGIVDPQPSTWDHVTIWPDGQTLTVAYWNGAEACSGLDRIKVTDDAGTLRLTPWIGTREDAAGADCADIRQLYSTVVMLDAPILAGGGGIPGMEPRGAHGRLAVPDASVVDVGPDRWLAADLGPDGRTGWVSWLGGDPACGGFAGTAVDTTVDPPALQVLVGTPPRTSGGCTLVGVFLRALFTLPAPLILGGDPPG